jgi:hypothetical protein
MMPVQQELWEGLPSPSPTTGEDLRDEGIERVTANTPSEWVDHCDAVIATMARSGREFTAEDLRSWVGEPPHPNAWGGRFIAAIKRGWIHCVGYRKAKRAKAHARVVAVYMGRLA